MHMSSITNQGFESQAIGQSPSDRRSRLETFSDILRAVGSGAQKQTHIMYKANLSWSVVQEYIATLESQGLVEQAVEDNKRVYRLSQSGFDFLNRMLSVQKELGLSGSLRLHY